MTLFRTQHIPWATAVVFMALFPVKQLVRVLAAFVPLCMLAGCFGTARYHLDETRTRAEP